MEENFNANLGWLYYRYYYEGLEDLLKNKDEDHSSYFSKKDNEIIKSAAIQIANNEAIDKKISQNILPLKLTTTYPGLITGIGINHETGLKGESKLGLQFDYTTGLPYIPGSSVKGVLRSLFPESKNGKIGKEENDKKGYIISLFNDIKKIDYTLKDEDIELLRDSIFSGYIKDAKFDTNPESDKIERIKRDIFFDAFVVEANEDVLGIDYITPHKDELKDPTPLKFMKIMPNVSFEFSFLLNDITFDNGITFTADDKLQLFKRILLDIGIGAKTNVGYGQFKDYSASLGGKKEKEKEKAKKQAPQIKSVKILKDISATYTNTNREAKATLKKCDNLESKFWNKAIKLEIPATLKLRPKDINIIVDVEVENGNLKKAILVKKA